MNTYGLFSVNCQSFQIGGDVQVSPRARIVGVTYLKVHNMTLNILGYVPLIHSCFLNRIVGYIPGVSLLSGTVRVAFGLTVLTSTLIAGDPDSKQGGLTGRLYYESLITAITQIARGILEAFVPFGWTANLVADVIATPYNFSNRTSLAEPIGEPNYPLAFKWLAIV